MKFDKASGDVAVPAHPPPAMAEVVAPPELRPYGAATARQVASLFKR